MNAPAALSARDAALTRAAPVPTCGVRATWRTATDIDPAFARAWDALARAASEPAIFAERWYLQPALAEFDPAGAVRLLCVHNGSGALIGVMPVAPAARYGPVARRHAVNWRHANAFHGAPLVRAGEAQSFWRAALRALDDADFAGGFLHVAQLTEHGPLHHGLCAAAAADGRASPVVHREQRALLQSKLSPDAYWEAAVRGKKRKELRRQANRLAECGETRMRRWTPGEDIAQWVDAFLALEARGWKGANGSALASSPATARWFRAVIAAAAREPDLMDMRALDLDGRPIAMLISFYRGAGGFSFKTCFDEELARFSPGVLLQQANLDILARSGTEWVDSCAAPDHPMIDGIWQERRSLVWVNVPLGGTWNRAAFALQSRAEQLWHRIRAARRG